MTQLTYKADSGKQRMDAHMALLAKVSTSKILSAKVRFACVNVLDCRTSDWNKRCTLAADIALRKYVTAAEFKEVTVAHHWQCVCWYCFTVDRYSCSRAVTIAETCMWCWVDSEQ